ncbi:hypothetical protein [Polaromonas sp.]|uniref:hypothetical protein n=1 Tax=Polaromonas sp. TaxID=1869339 RepID=UPI001811F9FA|nr:hypothetical protein [Polaromonas sp.]NML86242.1 hypothetical protein [Polaromonas sp.]
MLTEPAPAVSLQSPLTIYRSPLTVHFNQNAALHPIIMCNYEKQLIHNQVSFVAKPQVKTRSRLLMPVRAEAAKTIK